MIASVKKQATHMVSGEGQKTGQALMIPKWLGIAVSIALATVLPFTVWVAATLFDLQAEMRARRTNLLKIVDTVERIDRQMSASQPVIQRLEAAVDRHLQDPSIHARPLIDLDSRLRVLEERMRGLSRLNRLMPQSERDLSGPPHAPVTRPTP